MKGKLPSIVMVFVALALVFSMAAVVAPNANEDASAALTSDRHIGMPMPSMTGYTLMPDADAAAFDRGDDGTIACAVTDESGVRWGTTLGDSIWAIMISTDNGYHWTLGWTLPEDDEGPIVDVVMAPGYSHPGWIYFITPEHLYYSMDGGDNFYRTSTDAPGVDPGDGDQTSLDVAPCPSTCPTCDEYVAVVGVAGGARDGVFTYNLEGVGLWLDMELGNAPAATNDFPAYEVAFSPGYVQAQAPGDLVIVAVSYYHPYDVNAAHPSPLAAAIGADTTIVTTYAGQYGTWGIENWDAPMYTGAPAPVAAEWARLDFPGDYHWQSNPYTYVVVDCGGGAGGDAWRAENWLTSGTVGGRSIRLNLLGGADVDCDTIAVYGSSIFVEALVGLADPWSGGDQAQVAHGMNLRVSPNWNPSMNPPSGNSLSDDYERCFVWWDGTDAFASTADDDDTMSAFSRGYLGALGWAWHGTGLVDDIVYSSNILDSGWYYAVPTSISASQAYATGPDNTFFFTTFSEWACDESDYGGQSMWRQSEVNSVEWERVLWQGMWYSSGLRVEQANDYEGPVYEFTYAWVDEIWTVETSPDFPATGHAFVLGGKYYGGAYSDHIFFTPDSGNTWLPFGNMPLNQQGDAVPSTLCPADYQTVLYGTEIGYVYKTGNRGASWTDGVITEDEHVTDLNVSPIFSNTGAMATDKCVLAATFDDDEGAAKVWLSCDGAEELFVQVGPEVADTGGEMEGDEYQEYINPVMCDFDNGWGTDNFTVYAAASAQLDYYEWDDDIDEWILEDYGEAGLYRAEVDTLDPQSASWDTLVSWQEIIAMAPPPDWDDEERWLWFTDLDVGPYNTIYAPFGLYDDYWERFTWGGMFRCLDGTLHVTEWDNANQGMQDRTGFMFVDAVPGTTHLWSIDIKLEEADDRIIPKIMMYEDILCQHGPTLVAPADASTNVGAMVGDNVNVIIDWEDVQSSAAVTYQWQVSDDSGFTTLVAEGFTTNGFAQVTGLENGFQYFWRVRVIWPVLSPWSPVDGGYSYTTVIGTETAAPKLEAPIAGATGVSLAPTFEWSALGWADSYQIQVSTDPSFDTVYIVVDVTLGDQQAYQSSTELVAGTTYFWHVKAMSATQASNWSATGSFTTAFEPAAAGTPVWVWVLIVIGAILALVVIVLIVQTRRPA